MADNAFPNLPLEFGMFDWIEDSGFPHAEVYEHKLRLAEMADRAGFYCWHLAEHQGTPLSMDVSPALVLSAAAQRTSRVRIGALTFCLPWYNAYRFYNEVCMLDQMSRGRLDLGVGRGISPIEGGIYGIGSIEESREKYRETLDIFMTACRSEVLDYEGKYYTYKDVELHNHPYQRPYPPLWFPSSDRNSIDFTASHGYNTLLNFGTPAEVRALFDHYRETWVQHKDDPGRHNGHVAAPRLGTSNHIVVAPTDGEAMALARPAHEVWAGHIIYLAKKHGMPNPLREIDFETRYERGQILIGSPRTVLEKAAEVVKESSVNYLMLCFSFGNLPPAHAERSLELFVNEVMEPLKGAVAAR